MNNVGSVSEMVNSSIAVLTRPSVATFEMFERRGNLQSALIYMGIAALISGVLGVVGGGILGLLGGVIGTLVGFIVFTYAVFFVGKSQGGTGSYDEVAYTFSLFSAPLAVIGAIFGLIGNVIPLLGCLVGIPVALVLLAAQVYLGYLAVQSSMNLRESGKAIITLIAAAVLAFIVNLVVAGVFGGAAALAS